MGTGAAINVCLGFTPRYVRLWNMTQADFAIAEWTPQMGLVTAMDEGMYELLTGATTLMTGNGIKAYTGGDVIMYDKTTSGRWEVEAAFPGGASVEEVYVDGEYERTATGDADYKCIGDVLCPEKYHGAKVKTPKGFTIGTESNINIDSERLSWMVIR